jgi:hypothetical protein
MDLKKLTLAAAAGTAFFVAAPAFASPPHWAPAHGWRAKHHHHHRVKPVVVYAPAPVYYVPAPVYYAPPPPRIVVPAPVIYGHIPVSPNVSVNFGFRL